MTLLSERQKLVASNIQDADTPGWYRTQDIDFHSEFENAAADETPKTSFRRAPASKADRDNANLDTGKRACWLRMRCG